MSTSLPSEATLPCAEKLRGETLHYVHIDEVGYFRPSWRERLRVWWKNFRNRRTARAYRDLTAAMKADPDFAHSWFCNVKMPLVDSGVGPVTADECARRLMKHLFGVEVPEK